MGSPAKLDNKAVEGVRIFTGGTVGEGAKLATELEKGVPAQQDILVPRLKEILVEQYGCTPKA
jgi:ferredoxin-nitrite reductase